MDSRSSDNAGHPSWDFVAGPPFVGFILNWWLLGVLSVQVYIYHIFFPNDPRSFKSLVYGIFALDWLQTVLLTSDMFENFIYRWGSSKSFSTIGLGWFSFVILGGVISAIVQLSFSWRLWILARSRILTGTVVLLALTQLTGSIVGGAQLHALSGTSMQSHSNVALTIWLFGSASVDVIIAVAMTLLLVRSKLNHTLVETRINGQHQLSHALVNRLIFFVVETGMMTASVAIVSIITFLAFPNTYLHECPVIILAKLYSNTLLAGFNNRAMIERGAPRVAQHQTSMFVDTTVHTSYVSPGRLESGLATAGSSGDSVSTISTSHSEDLKGPDLSS